MSRLNRWAQRWAKQHLRKRNCDYYEKDGKLYVYEKGDTEPSEVYDDFNDYTFYHNTWEYQDKTKKK